MAVRRADLGPASAWAEAVEEGYTGTRAEWAQALASVSTSAQQVAQASGIVTRAAEVDSALDQIDRGLSQVVTWTTGANLIDPLQAVGGRLSSAGTAIGTETTHKTTGWIPVQPMTSYTVKRRDGSGWGVVSYAQRWTAYTGKDLSTAIDAAASEAVMTFTTPAGAAYVRFSYEVDNHGALCMAPSASFPTTWEDYGRQYSYAAGIATQAELDAEETAREAADRALWDGIADEETARQAADADLQGDINGEAATRAAAISSIAGQLEAESNTREAADESIRGLIAEDFDEFETYSAGEYCIGPGGHLYLFTAEHSGEWSAADVDDIGDVGARFHGYDTALTYLGGSLDRVQGLIAGVFDPLALYDAGVHCIGPDGYLYRFTAAHSGEWNASDVTRVSVGSELVREDTRITTFGGLVQQLNTRVPLPGTLSAGTYHLVLTVDAQGHKSYTWEAMA